MHKIVRTAAIELQAIDNKEVVKVAGILNRLKNVFKQLTDREYAGAVEQLRADSGMVQATASQLKQRISELTQAISDGDVTGYDVALESVRDLTSQLAIELKKLNQDAKKNTPRKSTPKLPTIPDLETPGAESPATVPAASEAVPEPYLKHYTADDVKKSPDGLYTEVRRHMPTEHDVPFGPHKAGPKLKSFKWFQQFTPEDISIPSGAKSGSQNALFEEIFQLTLRVTNLSEKLDEKAIEDMIRSRWPIITSNFKQAILDGSLMEYSPPSKPGKGQATVPMGQIDMAVYTAPFEAIPGTLFECYAVMKDLAPSRPAAEKLVFRFPKFMRDKASGQAVGLNSSPVRRKSTSIPKRQEKPVEELSTEKKSSVRKEFLKSLVKNAGINPAASKQLSPDFWSQFVQMCGRLGANPEDLARVINSESGFDSRATNIQGGHVVAKGLNQFIESTAKSLGMSDVEWDNYENTSPEEQLKYVEKYFRNVGKATGQDGKWASATQLYVANFAPKYVQQASNPNAVLYSSDTNTKEYEQNKGLDRDGKGHITAGDLARSVQGKLPPHIVQAINAAKQPGATSMISQNEPSNDNVGALMEALVANVGPVENMVKQAILRKSLPTSQVLVTLSTLAAPYDTRMRFAKSAAFVLREIIDADTTIHSDGTKIELECSAAGSQFAVSSAVCALCDCVAKAINLQFSLPTVRHAVVANTISKYAKVN